MASSYTFRLRRALSSLHRSASATPPLYSSSPALRSSSSSSLLQSPPLLHHSRPFRSSSFSPFSIRSSYGNTNIDDDKIGPDTILFEGCDYNHWLITMDFPKDPKPTPEQMVQTYEETCAKGLNISLEEAKKRMYACSTTTYQGFQAIMTEEESEKFRGVPGVVFILPDSYIDPQNKEYGGDKYINGTIIPRPPPVQYGRQGGRYRDRNRNFDQPRYDRQGESPQNWQGNPSYNSQGPPQGNARNFGPSQNYSPQQNSSPSGQWERRDPLPNRENASGGRDNYQAGRGSPAPSYQGSYNQGWQGNRNNQVGQNYYYPQGEQTNYAPPPQGNLRRDGGFPVESGHQGQGMGGYQGQGVGGYQGQDLSGYQGQTGGSYGQGSSSGSYGQGSSSGSYGQGSSSGSYGQGSSSGSYGQGVNSSYGPGDQEQGERQRFAQGDPRNFGQPGTEQGKV